MGVNDPVKNVEHKFSLAGTLNFNAAKIPALDTVEQADTVKSHPALVSTSVNEGFYNASSRKRFSTKEAKCKTGYMDEHGVEPGKKYHVLVEIDLETGIMHDCKTQEPFNYQTRRRKKLGCVRYVK